MTNHQTPRRLLQSLVLGLVVALGPGAAKAADQEPWKNKNNALVVDAYEMNNVEWDALVKDKRIAGFISKASDGLPESFSCRGEHDGDTYAHCKTMWRKYAVSRELYQTRRMIARASGLLWGAYHLARPGNPVEQANHFLDYAEPRDDELMVLDIEGIDPDRFMSLDDAQIFAGHIKTRTGRYPILYTNHVTAKYIAERRSDYPILSRLPLWYARYKPHVKNVFPLGNWENYALWQFSSVANCNKKSCPYRVPGTLHDIDVNVVPMSREALKWVWAQGHLLPKRNIDPEVAVQLSGNVSAGTGLGAGLDLSTTVSALDREITRFNYQEF
ncbi:lysozyme [Rhizobiaceae bacterium n13]|nr:GH25 family lysozyme [Fererhizobium litorale]MDI7861470.1 lysozyme [Fererhizobium litorale]